MREFSDIDIFARVVTAGSMSAAGREIGVSPAVVSKRLKRLEERLGTRLLQRTTRRISLTETGHGFYQHAVAILEAVEDAEDFISHRSTQGRGTLKISAPTTFGRLHITPHLAEFLDTNPDLMVNLTLGDDHLDLVGEGFDVAIRIGEMTDSSYVARRLAPVRRVLCASPDYLGKQGRPLSLSDLRNHSCLSVNGDEVWRLQGPEGTVCVQPIGNLKTNSNDVVHEAVLGGLGIALRAAWEIDQDIAAGKIETVLTEYMTPASEGIYAVYPSRRFLPIKVRLFIDYLIRQYHSLSHQEKNSAELAKYNRIGVQLS